MSLNELCRACGLCCDGSLFGRVGLENGEGPRARRAGLTLVEDGASFSQPCGAHRARGGQKECAAYDERPAVCRRFECKLLVATRASGDGEGGRRVVAETRALLAEVAHQDPGAVDPRRLAELRDALDRYFARAPAR